MKIAISSSELLLEVRCIKAPLESLGVLGVGGAQREFLSYCSESPPSRGVLSLLCSQRQLPQTKIQATLKYKSHQLQCPAAIIQEDHLEGHFWANTCSKCLLVCCNSEELLGAGGESGGSFLFLVSMKKWSF